LIAVIVLENRSSLCTDAAVAVGIMARAKQNGAGKSRAVSEH
jgi:hypothetical protein